MHPSFPRSATALVWLVLLAAVPWSPAADPSADITGKVVRVHDGDTLTLLKTGSHKHLQIRLEGIDAPEMDQSFGNESRLALDGMVYSRQVTIHPVTIDKYGRTIARVFLGTLDVNLEMVRLGFAWRYDHYSQEPALGFAQEHARELKWGLWQERHPVPPWDWRHAHPLK
jgi:micrococcal nuclease